MRLLVVEDDRALGQFLKKGIEREGHTVHVVEDGEAAVTYAESMCPDLVVLDLSLPKMDGMEVLGEFGARQLDLSVLVLTGRCEVDARVRCLDLGADDCLLKPFSFSELAARCRSLLRRREKFNQQLLRHGQLVLHRLERKVTYKDHVVDLTSKEFALLEYLLVRRGEAVSRTELMEQVWQMPATAGTNVVDVYINYLRRKLAAAAPEEPCPSLIETVRGTGYRLGGSPSARGGSVGHRGRNVAAAWAKRNCSARRRSLAGRSLCWSPRTR